MNAPFVIRVAFIDATNTVQVFALYHTLPTAPNGWTAVQVPQGVACCVGATANGDGTYTLPPPSQAQLDAGVLDQLQQSLAQSMAILRNIRDGTGAYAGGVPYTAAQTTQGQQAQARAILRLCRIVLRILDSTN